MEYEERLDPLKNIDLKNNYHQQKWKFRTILTIKRVGIKFLFKACSKPLFEMKYLVMISSFYFLLRTNVRFFLKLLLSLLRVWHMCVSDIASMQEQWIQVKRNQFFSILFFFKSEVNTKVDYSKLSGETLQKTLEAATCVKSLFDGVLSLQHVIFYYIICIMK